MNSGMTKTCLAVLFGVVLAATGLWASPASEEERGRGDGQGDGDGPGHRRDGDRAGVWRDVHLCHGGVRTGACR